MITHELAQARLARDEIAAGYDRTNTPSQMWLGNEGLRRAELCPGMRFLDLNADEITGVREALDGLVRERAGGPGPATLTAPINIGIATK